MFNNKLSIIFNHLIDKINTSSENSDLKKLIYLQNYILSTVEYPNIKLIKLANIKFPFFNFMNNRKRNYFSAYGTLVNKNSLCFGIAKTIKKILDDPSINIKNQIVKGYINSPLKGKIVHAWNIVYIKNIPYHLDTTFDITRNPFSIKKTFYNLESNNELPRVKSNKFYAERFLVNDSKLKSSHLWNEKKFPKCIKSYPRNEINKVIHELILKDIKFEY